MWGFRWGCPLKFFDLTRIRIINFDRGLDLILSLNLLGKLQVALVSSKLDYCNSLFHNMPEKDIARLQHVQNCLARVVSKASRFSRSVPILKRLHWLPVKFRIHFKICAITFRTLKDLCIWLIYLFGQNAQNIYAPLIRIDLFVIIGWTVGMWSAGIMSRHLVPV